ncbi:MAG: cobalamin receptor, partial [Rikenellaceae bacterium]
MNNTLYYSLLSNEKYNIYEQYEEKQYSKGLLKSRMDEIGLKSNFEYTVTPNYTLTYGLNFSRQYFQPQRTSFDRNGLKNSVDYRSRNLSSAALFVNNKYTLHKYTFNAGLRVAMYDNSDNVVIAVEPRVSVSYDFNKSSALWLSYVRNSQPLFSLNKYYFSIPIDYWIPFTGKTIQHSDQVAIGARKSFGDVLDITAEVYYKKSSNLSLVYNSDDFLSGDGGYDVA